MQADDIRATETTHIESRFPFATDSAHPAESTVALASAATRQQDSYLISSSGLQPPQQLSAAELLPLAPRGKFGADDGRGMPQDDNRHALLQQICQPAAGAPGTLEAFVTAHRDATAMSWSPVAAEATRGAQPWCAAVHSAAMPKPSAAVQGHRLADLLGAGLAGARCADPQHAAATGSQQPSAATHDPVAQHVVSHRKLQLAAPGPVSSGSMATSPHMDLLYLLTSPDPSPSATAAYNISMEATIMSSLAAAAAAAQPGEQQQQQQQRETEHRAVEPAPAAAGGASSSEELWIALGRGGSGVISHLKPPKLQVSLLSQQQQQPQQPQQPQQVAQEQQQLSLPQHTCLMQISQLQQQQSQLAGLHRQQHSHPFQQQQQQQQQQQAWMAALRHSEEDAVGATSSSHTFHTPFADRSANYIDILPPAAAGRGVATGAGAAGAADGISWLPSNRTMSSGLPGLPDLSSGNLAPAASSLGTGLSSGSRLLSAASSGAFHSRTVTGSLPVSLPPQPSTTAAAAAPAGSAGRAAGTLLSGCAAVDGAGQDGAAPLAAAGLQDQQQQQQVVLRHTRQITCKTYLKRLNVTQYMSDHLLPRMEGSVRVSSQRQQGLVAAAAAAAHGSAAKASDDEYEPVRGSSSSNSLRMCVSAGGGNASGVGKAAGSGSGSGRTYEMLFKVQVKLVDCSGLVWPVTYEGVMCAGQRHLRLTCGWSELIKAKRISIGDAITFERRGSNRAALAVTVQRAGQDPEQAYPGLLPAEDQVKVLMGQLKHIGGTVDEKLPAAAAVGSPTAAAAAAAVAGHSAPAVAAGPGAAASIRRLSTRGAAGGSSNRRVGGTLRSKRQSKRVREMFDSGDSDEDEQEYDSDLESNSSSSAKSASRARGSYRGRSGGRVGGSSRASTVPGPAAAAPAAGCAGGQTSADPPASAAALTTAMTGMQRPTFGDGCPGTSFARAGSFPGAVKPPAALGLLQTNSITLPSMVGPAAAALPSPQPDPTRSGAAGRSAPPQLPLQQPAIKAEQDSSDVGMQRKLLSSWHTIPAGSRALWMQQHQQQQQQQQQDVGRVQLPLTMTGKAMSLPALPEDVNMQGGGSVLQASNAAAAVRKRAAATPLAKLAAANRSAGALQRQLQDLQQQRQHVMQQQPQQQCPQFGRSSSTPVPDAAGAGGVGAGSGSPGVEVQGWQVSTGLFGGSHSCPYTTAGSGYQQLQPHQPLQPPPQQIFGGPDSLNITSGSLLSLPQQLTAAGAGLQRQRQQSGSAGMSGPASQQVAEDAVSSGIAAVGTFVAGGCSSWPSDSAAVGPGPVRLQLQRIASDAAAVSAWPGARSVSSAVQQQQLLPPDFCHQHLVTASQWACDVAYCSAPQLQQMVPEQLPGGRDLCGYQQLQQPSLQTGADSFVCYQQQQQQQQQQQAEQGADPDVGAMDADVLVDTLLHILASEPSADLPQSSQLMELSQQQQQQQQQQQLSQHFRQMHQGLSEQGLDQEQTPWHQPGHRSQLAPPTLLPYDSVSAAAAAPAAPPGPAAPGDLQQFTCGPQQFEEWL